MKLSGWTRCVWSSLGEKHFYPINQTLPRIGIMGNFIHSHGGFGRRHSHSWHGPCMGTELENPAAATVIVGMGHAWAPNLKILLGIWPPPQS
jgi:hypothetical protein